MIVLMTAVVVFTQDATTLVVGPIERMMTLVQRLAENPLGDLKKKKNTEMDPSDETYLLEQTLTKISGLLQVGFGVAGAEVIAKSMATELGDEMNFMLPGKRITAVFGFAIIEDFTVTCGALEEETCTCSSGADEPPRRALRADAQVHQHHREHRARGRARVPRRAQQEHRLRVSVSVEDLRRYFTWLA